MASSPRGIEEFELALLRRGVDEVTAQEERCDRCRRTPLIGERVYLYDSGVIACELCRPRRSEAHVDSRLVHTPAFGHTIRITDRRPVA